MAIFLDKPKNSELIKCNGGCYRFYPKAELLKFGKLHICQSCRARFFQTYHETQEVQVKRRRRLMGIGVSKKSFSLIFSRLIAGCIDVIIIFFGMLLLNFAIGLISGFFDREKIKAFEKWDPWFIFLISWVVYETASIGIFGTTFGKKLSSLVIVNKDGQPVGYIVAFMRVILQNSMLAGLVYYSELPNADSLALKMFWLLLALPILFKKRTWPDLIFGTYVIKK